LASGISGFSTSAKKLRPRKRNEWRGGRVAIVTEGFR
jgi:hypothetical protein